MNLAKGYFNSILIHLSFGICGSFKVYMNIGHTDHLMQAVRMCLIWGNYRSVAVHIGEENYWQYSKNHPYGSWLRAWNSKNTARKFYCIILHTAADAAKLLQSCLTLCDPIDGSPPSLGLFRQEHCSGLPFSSPARESAKWKWSHSVMSDSLQPHGLQPTRLLPPWDFPGKSTGVGCHCLLCFVHHAGTNSKLSTLSELCLSSCKARFRKRLQEAGSTSLIFFSFIYWMIIYWASIKFKVLKDTGINET